MRITLSIWIGMLSLSSSAQNYPPTTVFDKEGRFVLANTGNFHFKPNDLMSLNGATVPFDYTNLLKISRQQYERRIRNTLRNIQNDSLQLKEMYKAIWGEAFYDDIIAELTQMEMSFLDASLPAANTRFLPDYNSLLRSEQFAQANIKVDMSKSPAEIDLIVKDPFLSLFRMYYNNKSAGNIQETQLDRIHCYLDGWRSLELLYEKKVIIQKELEKYSSNLMELNIPAYERIKKTIDSINIAFSINPVRVHIKSSAFIKSMLWFTEGLIQTTPFINASEIFTYPKNEKMYFVDNSKRKSLESLAEQDLLKTVQQSSITWNRVSVPKFLSTYKEEIALGFSLISDQVAYLDGTTPLLDHSKTSVWLHNIPATAKVKLSATASSQSNRRIVNDLNATLNDAATSIGGLLSRTAQLNTLLTLFNPPLLKSETPIIIGEQKSDISFLNGALDDSTVVPNRTYPVRFPYHFYSNNNHNKKTVLMQEYGYLGSEDQPSKQHFEGIVDAFIKSDEYVHFYTSNQSATSTEINRLTERFEAYYNLLSRRRLILKGLIEQQQLCNEELESLLNITVRSLPPATLDEKTNTSPRFYTEHAEINWKTSDKELAVTANLSSNDETDEVKLQFPKLQLKHQPVFDFSTGVIYTVSPYLVAKDGDNNLPRVDPGNQVQFMASIQFYPFRPFNRTHWVRTNKVARNIFVFTGLTIPRPLDNLIVGAGYSIWQDLGIKGFAGYHFYKNTRYSIRNNQVIDKQVGLEGAGLTLGIGINPATLIKFLGIIQ